MTNPDQPPEDPGAADFGPEDILGSNVWAAPWMGPFLEALCKIPNISAACRTVGISRGTYRNYRLADEDFAAAVAVAKDVGLDLLEQIAHRRATIGEPRQQTRTSRRRVQGENGQMEVIEETTVTVEETEISNALLMRMLEAHRPERWSRNARPGWQGDQPSGPVIVVVERVPTRERMLELAALARELEPGAAPPDIDAPPNGA